MKIPQPARYGEKFYHSRWNNLGMLLAIGAGLLSYAFLTWPIAVPQGRGDFGVFWGIGAFMAAGAYLFAAWKADTNWRLSRAILMIVGIIQVGVGVLMSLLIGPTGSALEWLAGLYDIIPAVLAVIAGMLIHPPSGERPTPEHVWQELKHRQEVRERV